MFKVEYRFVGEGLWSRTAAPMTQEAASELADSLCKLGFADQARIVPSRPGGDSPYGEPLDLKI